MRTPRLADYNSDLLQTWMHQAEAEARQANRWLAVTETLAELEGEGRTKADLEALRDHCDKHRKERLRWAEYLSAELDARHAEQTLQDDPELDARHAEEAAAAAEQN
jgi:hypothetical protein